MTSQLSMEPRARRTRGRGTNGAVHPVRTTKDGTEISAYDIIRHVFGWNTRAQDKAVKTMARRVRETGFALSTRALPGGGKPTATFAAARLDAFLDALDAASLHTDSILAGAVAAYRRAPVTERLLQHIATATSAASPRRRKDNLTRRSPLCLRVIPHDTSIYSAVGHCGAVLMATMGVAGAPTLTLDLGGLPESTSPHTLDGNNNADAVGGKPDTDNIINDDNAVDDDDDGGLRIDDDSDEDNQVDDRVDPSLHRIDVADSGIRNDVADDDTLLSFVETRAMPLATPARPLRVWCTGGRAAVRLCAVWPMGDGAHWGVSLPRRDSTAVDYMGTIERADAVRMLARFVVVPGVVLIASRQWSSTRGPVVGPEVRGARALCDLASGLMTSPLASPPQPNL
ncbi:hypothetical protein TW95_gp0996 [Pandoravirus inopinatum]|uniref:Uncharacterized protein n=1 Tax=Pandoravirus inopinatum TaxID=1605721 RepID=A0A0B5J7B5_9VIRU|nr:hypothetical protein TW95_gp0996 [Pandoravirus inopinatum]AJF97730.1 hypothetical protein [Pandoravirus inopinatum]